MTFKDSGERTEFETGATRDCQAGKGRMDLLPFRALMAVSKIYETGCLKYGDLNWEKGIPCSRYADSALRHFSKWMIGHGDEPHLDMAIWNLLCLRDTLARIQEGLLPESLNDLPCWVTKEAVDEVMKSEPPYRFEIPDADVSPWTKEIIRKIGTGELKPPTGVSEATAHCLRILEDSK